MHACMRAFIHPFIDLFIYLTCVLSTFYMLGIIPKGLKMDLVPGLRHIGLPWKPDRKLEILYIHNFQNCQVLLR